jgi:citrate synthase
VTVLESAISSIQDDVLRYRGYAVTELATAATFEEVAWLLWTGSAPDEAGREMLAGALRAGSALPQALGETLRRLPDDPAPLVRVLAALPQLPLVGPALDGADPEGFPRRAALLLGAFAVLAGSAASPERLEGSDAWPPSPDRSVARVFLELARGVPPSEPEVRALDTVLTLYADHELNASTFTGRVTASTRASLVPCVLAALCALSGPLHGGVDRHVRAMLAAAGEEGAAGVIERYVRAGQPLPGFGHAVYQHGDPRAPIMRDLAFALAPSAARRPVAAVTREVEEEAARRGLPPANVDLYTVAVYRALGIPDALSPLVFATGRVAGWCAHIQEQYVRNRLIRPRAGYVGVAPRHWGE